MSRLDVDADFPLAFAPTLENSGISGPQDVESFGTQGFHSASVS